MDEKMGREMAAMAAAQCVGLRLRYLSRVVSKIYDQSFKPLNIKGNQVTMLLMLFINGESTPADLGKALEMEKSTVSRNVERMRKKGWIEITKRAPGAPQMIRVTPEGKELLRSVHTEWRKAQQRASKLLGDEGVQSVQNLYNIICNRPGKKK